MLYEGRQRPHTRGPRGFDQLTLLRPSPVTDQAQGGLQPRPVGRAVLAGRPYRPCFPHGRPAHHGGGADGLDGDGGEEEEHVADPPEQNGGAAWSLAFAVRALVVLRLQAHAAAAISVHGRYWRSDHGNTRRDGSGKWPSGGYYDGRCDEALDDESDRQHRGRSGGAAAEFASRRRARGVGEVICAPFLLKSRTHRCNYESERELCRLLQMHIRRHPYLLCITLGDAPRELG